MMQFLSINPTTEEVAAAFDSMDPISLVEAADRAGRAQTTWARTPLVERAHLLQGLARTLRARTAEFSRLMALEMGKPLAEGAQEIEKCAWLLDHVTGAAERDLADEEIVSDAARSYVRFAPLGTILAIMPWNFPFWQVFRAAAPALAAGNTMLLKHAPSVPRSALAIRELFRSAGFPEGVFQTVFADHADVPALIAHPAVQGVTLTGSERAGREVAALAGRAIKKVVLELGGSDPFIVLEDADLVLAVQWALKARTLNAGQSCIAAKRFIILDQIADEFVARFAAALQALRVGDPLDPSTQVGPLAREDLRRNLARQVDASRAAGATLVVGGRAISGRGWFYEPTLLDHVLPGMPVMEEETFGPVAPVARVRNEEEAVRLANATRYGLGSSVWTGDRARGERIAGQLEAGAAFVNGMVKSDPRLPFGGIRASGHGRELAVFGIREFVNVKTVWISP